jgi:hypothetical protein
MRRRRRKKKKRPPRRKRKRYKEPQIAEASALSRETRDSAFAGAIRGSAHSRQECRECAGGRSGHRSCASSTTLGRGKSGLHRAERRATPGVVS